jgi:hypothetical protein
MTELLIIRLLSKVFNLRSSITLDDESAVALFYLSLYCINDLRSVLMLLDTIE